MQNTPKYFPGLCNEDDESILFPVPVLRNQICFSLKTDTITSASRPQKLNHIQSQIWMADLRTPALGLSAKINHWILTVFFLAFFIKEIRTVAIDLLTLFAGIGLVPVNTSWATTVFSKSVQIRMYMHAQNPNEDITSKQIFLYHTLSKQPVRQSSNVQ